VLRTGAGVRAGQLMTTGTYTGLNFATPGRRVRATFDGFGAAEVDVA
jgi:2-keto-4-pentenoate hydratase